MMNFAGGGWTIISGDDVAYPIIAFSRQGSYASDNHPVQFDQWMENVSSEIHDAIVNQDVPLQETQSAWDRLNVSSDNFAMLPLATLVEPLLTTTWRQGTYYNTSCPFDSEGTDGHVLTGCVATAISQVMKYHNYPVTGIGSHNYTDDSYGIQSVDFAGFPVRL
ncbi:MAG: C10 family peptidase [Candidatus Marinimicrobia bacterium]|nr:C10 family peptidase [Candidatus Neomarinimicrobiota bacterium]